MRMYIITTLSVLSVCLARPMDDPAWKEYKLKFGKVYKEEEEASRYEIWNENVKEILMHNAEKSKSYERGINQFTDMSAEEFKQNNGGCSKLPEQYLNGSIKLESEPFLPLPSNVELPSFVDWRSKGFVTGVKDQGACGSCYSFSATGALEGQWFKKTGKLINLSEQQIVDCSIPYQQVATFKGGCEGGWYAGSWLYLKETGGIETEFKYPYKMEQKQCSFKKDYVVATCRGLVLWSGSENILKQAVATVGPISVSIDSTHRSFASYKRGVYYEPSCGNQFKNLDHDVLIVGYGTEDGRDYWLVKNSWGVSYGEAGYIKMSRNRNNNCGIATIPGYPLV